MAVRETLEFDLRRALSQVNELGREIDEIRKPVSIPITITGNIEPGLRTIDSRLEEIESGVEEINSELAELEVTAGRTVSDFSQLARELDISETEARDLTREIIEARSASERTSEAAKEVARSLGLSEEEAGRFASEIGKAAGKMETLDNKAKETERSMDRTGASVDKLRTGLGRLVGAAVAFVGIRELGQFAVESIKAFSALEESTSKAHVVFGPFAADVLAFVEDAPTKLGSTSAAALEMAASFGNLFLSVGLGQEAAADMSGILTQLGSDLASFNNISVDEALEKLRSGLVGQAEPLRTVGVLLSETAVALKAQELGLGGANGKLSEAEKVMARYAIILEQTVTAQGDFARTSDGIANSTRTAVALFGEFKTKVGEALAPAFAELVRQAPQIIEGFERMVPGIAAAALALADFIAPKPGQADFIDFINFLSDLPRGFGEVGNTLSGIGNSIRTLGEGALAIFTQPFTGKTQAEVWAEGMERGIAQGQQSLERLNLQGLVDDLREGIDPATALANRLADVAKNGKIDPAFVRNLVAIAGTDLTRTGDAIRALVADADRLGLEADDLYNLQVALAQLASVGESSEADRFLARLAIANREVADSAPGVLNQVEVLTLLRTEADLAGISFETLLSSAEDFPELAGFIAQLEPATAGLGVAQERLNAFAASFETTEIRVSDAIDELGLLPAKLKITRDQFLANLRISAAEEAEFQANLIKLFDIAPALATKLRDGGAQNRELVKGFLDDITSAENAESVLTGNAQDITGIFTDAVEEFIGQEDFSPLGLDKLIEFLEGFGNTAVTETAIRALQAQLQRLLNEMQFEIRGNLVIVPPGPGSFGGSFPIGPPGGVTVIQTINNPTTTDLPTNTAQLQQSTSAVAQILNGVPQ